MIHARSTSVPFMSPSAHPSVKATPVSSGGRAVAVRGQLPLTRAELEVDAVGGAARVRLEQVFVNPHAEPLRVRYELPLPADAAVSGFAFRIGDRRIVGHVDEIRRARETFERALAEGRTAALLEETRTSLFSQELGNVPPGATVVAEIVLDQPLSWVDAEGSWEWRFPLTAAPRYLGAVGAHDVRPSALTEGRTPDASRVMLDVTEDETGARAALKLGVRDVLVAGRSPESPSHPLQIDASGGALRVSLGGGGLARLDRDLVVRWPVALASATCVVEAARSGGRGEAEEICAVVTVVPPAPSAARDARRVRRDLAILLDTSGSMDGEPLAQAKRIASALVASLTDDDGLDLVEFSSSVRRFRSGSVRSDARTRKEALAWIKRLGASGGTEMLSGITEALAGIRPEAQRQVVVVTDGLIGFERDVVSAVQAGLPRGSRVHTVGVGSATNRTLLAGVARVGGGVEVIVGLGEDPERAAKRILARTEAPVVVDLAVEGAALLEHAPARLPDLFAGAPARLALRLNASGGEIVVRGRAADGPWQARVQIPSRAELAGADAPAKLFARERAADLETELSAGRARDSVDRDLLELGLRYAIATRVTSWVAATEEVTVDPTAPTRDQTMPQSLPYGMSATGLGLRPTIDELASAAPVFPLAAPYHVHPASMGAVPPPPPAMGAPPPMMPAPRMSSVPMGGPVGFGGAPPGARPAAPRLSVGIPTEKEASEGAAPPSPAKRAQAASPASRARASDDFADGGRLEEASVREEAPKQRKGADADADEAPRETLLGSIARRVRGLFERDEAPPPAPPAPPASAPPAASAVAGPAVQRQRGRVSLLTDDDVIIVVKVAGEPFDTRGLEVDVLLVTASGEHVRATLHVEISTRAGVHAPGATVRFVLRLSAPMAAPTLVFLTSSQPGVPPMRVEIDPG